MSGRNERQDLARHRRPRWQMTADWNKCLHITSNTRTNGVINGGSYHNQSSIIHDIYRTLFYEESKTNELLVRKRGPITASRETLISLYWFKMISSLNRYKRQNVHDGTRTGRRLWFLTRLNIPIRFSSSFRRSGSVTIRSRFTADTRARSGGGPAITRQRDHQAPSYCLPRRTAGMHNQPQTTPRWLHLVIKTRYGDKLGSGCEGMWKICRSLAGFKGERWKYKHSAY